MILYTKNLKDSTVELIHEFSSGCKINIQKSVVFWYTNNEISEKETHKTTPFKTASKPNT